MAVGVSVGPGNSPIQTIALGIAIAFFSSGSLIYLLAPAFSARESSLARLLYGSHVDVLLNTASAIVLSSLLISIVLFAAFGVNILEGNLRASLARVPTSPSLVAWALIALDLSLLMVIFLRILVSRTVLWRDLGLKSDRMDRLLAVGIAGGFALLLASVMVQSILAQFGVYQNQLRRFWLPSEMGGDLLPLLLAALVLAPIAEEAFFRGYVFQAYLAKKGEWQAYLFSSLLFAVVHLDWAAFIPIFVIGLILAFILNRTGSLIPAIIAHSLNNSIALGSLYLFSSTAR